MKLILVLNKMLVNSSRINPMAVAAKPLEGFEDTNIFRLTGLAPTGLSPTFSRRLIEVLHCVIHCLPRWAGAVLLLYKFRNICIRKRWLTSHWLSVEAAKGKVLDIHCR